MGSGSEAALAIALMLMMLAVALGLRRTHFEVLAQRPRIYFTGVIGQMVGLPLLTLGLCFLINPQPSVALGMILIACCPGGTSSNLLSLYARANTALSVSLTATSSILAAFITPISILFWSALYSPTRNLLTDIDFNPLSFLVQISIVLALPLAVGIAMVRYAPKLAQRLEKPLAQIAGLLLILIIATTVYRYLPAFAAIGLSLIGLVALHNGLGFLLGWLSGVVVRADTAERRALTIEIGIQNAGLAIVILLTQLEGLGGTAVIAGLWGTWHLIGGGALVGLFRWQDRRKASEA